MDAIILISDGTGYALPSLPLVFGCALNYTVETGKFKFLKTRNSSLVECEEGVRAIIVKRHIILVLLHSELLSVPHPLIYG